MTTGITVVATNRAARHEFHLDDIYEAGIVLQGTEVKSLRQGRASIAEGYVTVEGGEAWLENVHIPEYTQGTWTNHAPRRKRKLMLHAEEIVRLAQDTREKGMTIVPLKLYFSKGRAKVEIAVARGKKLHDKRHALKEQQDKREAQRAMSPRASRP